MKPKRMRVTGFTRFFLLLIIVAPLAYLGASYANGEDGIQNIKKLLGWEEKAPEKPAEAPVKDPADANVGETAKELEYLRAQIEELKAENERLKKAIWEKDQELAKYKKN